MNRCKIWILLFGLLTVQAAQAQDAEFIQRADKLYKNQIYNRAAEMYVTYLQQTYNYEINLKLAECYRMMHNTVDAEYWYGVIIDQNAADPDILKKYADLLKTNGKYKSAKIYYLKYAYDLFLIYSNFSSLFSSKLSKFFFSYPMNFFKSK